MTSRPRPATIDNAPGLKWKPRRYGWEARWCARQDLIDRGFVPKSARLWEGAEPDAAATAKIQDDCQRLQTEMLVWGRGGIPVMSLYTGTVASLIDCFTRDRDSSYFKLRYAPRRNYDGMMKRIAETVYTNDEGEPTTIGETKLSDIRGKLFLRWHENWTKNGAHIPYGHSIIGMFRTLIGYGSSILEIPPEKQPCPECIRLRAVLHQMKFAQGKPRKERITADQAIAICARARATGQASIALAQAFQFEGTLRQKDVIGEIVPVSEHCIGETLELGNDKWLRGITWGEIDGALILRHVTSKKQKEVVVDLKLAPMVLEELALSYPGFKTAAGYERAALPASGPVIVNERTGEPYYDFIYRRHWRVIATDCGIPASVLNMDSRAGAITEATDAGVPLELVRHAATHSDVNTTQRYSRGGEEKTAAVMKLRVAARNKSGTDAA